MRSGIEPIRGKPAGTDRPPPIFVADHPALDFVNTRGLPAGKEIEWLADGQDLIAWLSTAGLGDSKVLDGAAKEFGARRLDAAAAQARELREWLREFVHQHAGKPLPRLPAHELAPLNDLLGSDRAFRTVCARDDRQAPRAPGRGSLLWQRHRRKLPAVATLLLPVADAIGDLLTAEDFSLVGRCEGPGCSLVFLDRTKNHRRRWCSIAWCGNRAKAAAHRARQREGGY